MEVETSMTRATVVLTLVTVSGSWLIAQETKPVPKDAVRVSIPGCAKGAAFTTARPSADQPGTYDVAAMNTIVYGRKRLGTCTVSGSYCAGMNDMFYRVKPENVRITYSYSGIGFAGRPYVQVPSIEVTLINLPFQFYFIGWLFPARNIHPVATAMGEDLCSQSSSCTILGWTTAGG